MKHFWYEYGDMFVGIVMLVGFGAIVVLIVLALLDSGDRLNRKQEFCYSQGYSEYRDGYCFRLADGNTETLRVDDIE